MSEKGMPSVLLREINKTNSEPDEETIMFSSSLQTCETFTLH